MLQRITELRKDLHRHPEISGNEINTAGIIINFIKSHTDARIIGGIGGNGIAVIYDFPENGPSVMIRCELDALPIEETNNFKHRSLNEGASHKCGHDGHMAIVAGLIFKIKESLYKKGRIILLFQPAEETGKGAAAVLNDPKFKGLEPDFIFALHNIPGKPINSIINVTGSFSSTVESIAIYLKGKQSHASEPENGINPAIAISQLIKRTQSMNIPDINEKNFALLTPVYVNLGSPDYGISAGNGEFHLTLRTKTEDLMQNLKQEIKADVAQICEDQRLEYHIEYFDYFPATINNEECTRMVEKAARRNGYKLIEKETPFRFGEDFGWFSKKSKACMFGLGAGIDSPALHHADYDFPDEIIETGITIFSDLIDQILN
ncbi:amidohydrolase [Gramella sp. KN1008]|uniref:amidohydrolase n=1 Tax=Gramella sp. KN1008 TaxID=2529298 RepID=UPI001039568C|nr:amidohydrolase [Gramella sp. KN1008]TBW29193.1 amidohydrolase [Gramella sp. KN1008]